MKSQWDGLDFNEDYSFIYQESDEERTINYVTEKIRALEQSILNIKIEYESPSGLLIKKKDKLALIDYKNLLNNFFKEIQLINENLSNIVKSNNERKNNMIQLSEKYKCLYHLYTEVKINKEMLSESIQQKHSQLATFEEIIKQYENDLHSLQNKNNELIQYVTEENERTITNDSDFLTNLTEEKKISELAKEKKYFEDILKDLQKDRDELRKQNKNLKNNLTKKEEQNSEMMKELEMMSRNLKDILDTNEQVKNEKCHLKVENEVLKKENLMTSAQLEEMKNRLNLMKSYTNMGRLKKSDYWKDYSPLESDYAETYSSHKKQEENLDIKNYRLTRVHSLGNKFHNKPTLDAISDFNKKEKIKESREVSEFKIEAPNLFDSKNKFFSNKSLVIHSADNSSNSVENLDEHSSEFLSEVEEEKSSNKKDSDNREKVVALASCLNSSYSSVSGNQLSDGEEAKIIQKNFKQSVTTISITSSLKNLEVGLKNAKLNFQKSNNFVQTLNSNISTSNFNFANFTRSSFHQIPEFVVTSGDSFNILQDYDFTRKVNNIINININNAQKQCSGHGEENVFPQSNPRNNKTNKFFFDYIFENMKQNKKYSEILSLVDQNEIFLFLVKNQTPVYRYYSGLVDYLRNSYVNDVNNVKNKLLILF